VTIGNRQTFRATRGRWAAVAAALAILASMSTMIAITGSVASAASAGDLDPTWGSGGKTVTDFGQSGVWIAGSVLQPDGKLVTAGYIGTYSLQGCCYNLVTKGFVARYTTSGALDSTFGTGGSVIVDMGSSTDLLTGIALQTDGKIVLGGYRLMTRYQMTAVRLQADGSIDTSFGVSGVAAIDPGLGNGQAQAFAVAVQSDGSIVTAGQITNSSLNGRVEVGLARFHPDGSIDTSFGSGGLVSTIFSPGLGVDNATAVLATPGGQLVVTAESVDQNGLESGRLVRYNADGTLDTSFGSGGSFSLGYFVVPDSLTLLSDGRMFVGGSVDVNQNPSNPNNDYWLSRRLIDGSPDSSFGLSGVVHTNVIGNQDQAYASAVTADGGVVEVGSAGQFGPVAWGIVKYRADGSLDSGFGIGGIVTTTFTVGSVATGVAVQSDGRIVVAGDTQKTSGSPPQLNLAATARYGVITDPVISISTSSVNEPPPGATAQATMTISLDRPATGALSVDYATMVDSSDPAAGVPGRDYNSTSGTVTFNPGQTTATFSITVLGNGIWTGGNRVAVQLSNPVGPNNGFGTSRANLGINDYESPPVVSIADASVNEPASGQASMTFTVTQSGAPSVYTTLFYFITQDGTAAAGSDYGSVAIDTGSFAPGAAATQTFDVPVFADPEESPGTGNETFTAVLAGVSYASVGRAAGTGTIIEAASTPDNDLALSNMPTNITVPATSSAGATVSYTPPTAFDEAGDIPPATVSCTPASGSSFPIGTITVTCTATDADDLNSPVTASFTVTVTPPEVAVLPAMTNGAYGGYVTAATIQNTGTAPAIIRIAYFNQNGAAVGAGDSISSLPVNASWTVRQDNGNSFPSSGGDAAQAGSAVVYSSQPVASFVNEFAPGNAGDATSYSGVQVPSGVGATLYAPTIVNNAYGGYTTGIGLLNQGSSPTDVTITYRDGTGAVVKTQTVSALAAHAYQGLYSGDAVLGLPSGFAGTATITSSAGQPLGAIVNETGPGGQFSSYDAVASGSSLLNAPVALNNAFGGYYTGMGIQNTSASSGTVTVTYYDAAGAPTVKSFPIGANGSLGVYQGSGTDGPAVGAYTATITSTLPLAAIVNEVAPSSSSAKQSTSYNTFSAGSATLHLPLVENAGSDPWNTGEGIMNTGTASTTVTVNYYNTGTGAAVGTPQTLALAPHAFWGLYQPTGGLPSGTRATAVITTASGGQVAAICNESSSTTFMSYDGQ
jgi:uncharacterized delta-60 repeat protein